LHASINENEAAKVKFGADDSIYNGLLLNNPSNQNNRNNNSPNQNNGQNNGNNNSPNQNNGNNGLSGPIPSYERETNPYESNSSSSASKENGDVI